MQDKLEQAESKLKTIWGFNSFREGQEEAIQSVLSGTDTLVLFPTGGGKSLCYQVPALLFDGLTLVISPLVALMQDQVQQLRGRGISATFINSTIPGYEVEQRLVNARNGMYKLLFCAPERLKSHIFQAELPGLNIELVAVDEAHCISEWGHDFRPSYRQIRESLEAIAENTRWIALTATATPQVQKDILDNLGFEEPNVLTRGFSRPNLVWWVTEAENKRDKLVQAVKKASKKGDGLIYGGTRRNCEELAGTFNKMGIKAAAYHAGVEPVKRKKIQEQWIKGDIPLVVATTAFGMGIDKGNCRYVIHDEMPYSIESYYQEAGRAGRDGKESYPILLYRESDYRKAHERLKENYPTLEELQHAYVILCDSLNLAVGAEMDNAEPVDLSLLVKRGKLSRRKMYGALRLLDQLDIIAMREDVSPSIRLQFLISQELLSEFKKKSKNPEKAEFVDKLERIFGHYAFHAKVQVDLDYLLEKLEISQNSLFKALDVLEKNDQLLSYDSLGEKALVRVLDARSSRLSFSRKEVEAHRDNLFKKLEYMQGFISTRTCREVYLRNYFGDEGGEPCGHCDNCLHLQKKDDAQYGTFEVNKVYELISGGDKSLDELSHITGLKKAMITSILQHLIRESKITAKVSRPGYYSVSSE